MPRGMGGLAGTAWTFDFFKKWRAGAAPAQVRLVTIR